MFGCRVDQSRPDDAKYLEVRTSQSFDSKMARSACQGPFECLLLADAPSMGDCESFDRRPCMLPKHLGKIVADILDEGMFVPDKACHVLWILVFVVQAAVE